MDAQEHNQPPEPLTYDQLDSVLGEEIRPHIEFLKNRFKEHKGDIARNRSVTQKTVREWGELKQHLGEALGYFHSEIKHIKTMNKLLLVLCSVEALIIITRLY